LNRFFRDFDIVLLVVIWSLALVFGLVLFLFHYLYFIGLPRRAIKKYRQTDPERLRRYLERVVATPSLLGPSQKLVARCSLAGIYLTTGRHVEAVAHCRANLAILCGSRKPGRFAALEAGIRRRLADSLEAIGQIDEAEEQRQLATEGIDRAPASALRYLTRGTLLKRQNQHEEAYAAFQKALEVTLDSNAAVRIRCMNQMMLAAHHGGRPLDCLGWAEKSMALGAKGRLLRVAHRMAGLACGDLSRMEEAEQHYHQAYDAAASANNQPDMAEDLSLLADCLRKRGKLVEANEACIKAAAMDPKGLRMSLLIQGQILHAWGRYHDALAVLERFKDTVPLVIPHHVRRLRAAVALDRSRIETECGRASDAWSHIQEALAELGNDAKLGLISEAALSRVLAVHGLISESRQLAARLEPRLAAFERDPGTCRGVLYDLGMAACIREDHDAGIDYWTRYLDLRPNPVYLPTAHYQRGECHRNLGRLTEARDDYRAAVAMNLDTLHARLARRRLGEVALL
jgi:tetratricopeptide (TPR) repeat protein